jgi:hypothetical protein
MAENKNKPTTEAPSAPEFVTNYTSEDTFHTVALFTAHRAGADGSVEQDAAGEFLPMLANGSPVLGRIFVADVLGNDGTTKAAAFWWLGEHRGSSEKAGLGATQKIAPVGDALAANLRYLRVWVRIGDGWQEQMVPVAALGAQRLRKPAAVYSLGQRNASQPDVGERSLLIDGIAARLGISPLFEEQKRGTGFGLTLNLRGEVVQPESKRVDLGGWD